jgi:predicted DNA-binding transcriptional regulator AlpA
VTEQNLVENEPRVSLQEVSRLAAISPATLWRWIARGILPKPVTGLAASGNGRSGYWPISILARVRSIRHQQRKGATLEAIAKASSGRAAAI